MVDRKTDHTSTAQLLSISYDKSAAVVVLPAVGGGRLKDGALRRWLARGDLTQLTEPRELLRRILEVLDMPDQAQVEAFLHSGIKPGPGKLKE